MSLSDVDFEFPGASFQFAIDWTVPIEVIKNVFDSTEEPNCLESNRYVFPLIKNLEFSLNLTSVDCYKITVKCDKDLPIFLEDVLILVDDRIYRAKCDRNNTKGWLFVRRSVLLNNSFEKHEVIFHCIMSIPLEIKTNIPYIDEEEIILHHIMDCNAEVTNLPTKHKDYDARSVFEYSGRVPEFNVKMAMDLIPKACYGGSAILKALCAEFLMENLTVENVAEILSLATNFGEKHLVQKCSEFISQECKLVPAN